MAKRIQLVLNENVRKLGRSGDLVEVAPGYARNYLLPKNLAVPMTPGLLKQVEYRRAKERERLAVLKGESEILKQALLDAGTLKIAKPAGESGALFGTVTNADLAEAIQAAIGKEIDRREIEAPDVSSLGTYSAEIYLHPEVSATVTFEVVAQG